MVSRGVSQLKYIRLYFCDFSGSSTGVREFLKSESMKEFVEGNPHLKFDIFMRRGNHPYMSSTYINGYVKDQPLRNMKDEEIGEQFQKFNQAFGRPALKHNSHKVVSTKQSIQGQWNQDLWGVYPKHQLETIREVPSAMVEPFPNPEVRPKRVFPHKHTLFLRKKFPLPDYNKI